MVSGFMCPCHGIFAAQDEAAYILFKAGTSREGWWTNAMLIDQFTTVINIFERVHPGKVAVFCFDHSQNHQAQADDALVANRLNFNDGSRAQKFHLIRPTYWGPNNTEQSMVYIDEQRQSFQPKGAKRILQERGLWIDGLKMDCKNGCPGNGQINCCARTLIANQPDFLRQSETCWIKEVGQALHDSVDENNQPIQLRHVVEFFPKFHCELNPIEMFWAWMKAETRRKCDNSFNSLEANVPQVIADADSAMIRRHARRCLRTMDAYRKHELLVGPLLDYCNKKYSSHRRLPPEFAIDTFQREYENYMTEKKEKK
jgi:hypothetical protein